MTEAPLIMVRAMVPADVNKVAHLVAGSFAARLVPYMTATQRGWGDFARVVVSHPMLFPQQRLVVAESGGRLVGFADFRTTDETGGFLSYICVDPGARRAGVARKLLAHLTRTSSGLAYVDLDVFVDNVAALAMYRSLGFAEVSIQKWWRAPVVAGGAIYHLSIEQLPSALATLAAYGFCELRGELNGRPFHCGRIGDRVARCFDVEEFAGTLPSAIAGEFPGVEEVFAVLPGDDVPPAGSEAIATSVRMRSTDVQALRGER